MFVRQMSYLLALAREKHFTRAAESCCVTQSTLSSGLKALERELDMPLVLRGSRFIGLTPEGERVAEWASQIVSDYENLKQDVRGLRSGLMGTLRLGVVPAAMSAVAKLTAPLCAQHSGLSVNVLSLTSGEIQIGIDKFELDAGITYLDNEPLIKVRKIPLYDERYLLVTHVDSPLVQMPSVSWREAASENLCLLNESMQNRRILNSLARSFGIELTPSVTSNSYLAVCSHVCTGEWASIIPHTFSYIFRGCKELAFIELVGPKYSQSIGVVVSERDPLSPVAHALLRCAGRMVANRPLVSTVA